MGGSATRSASVESNASDSTVTDDTALHLLGSSQHTLKQGLGAACLSTSHGPMTTGDGSAPSLAGKAVSHFTGKDS